jgi:hypothetical protein
MINTTKKKDKQTPNTQLNLTMTTSRHITTSDNWINTKKSNLSMSSNSEPSTSPQVYTNKNKKKKKTVQLFSSQNRFDMIRPNEITNEEIMTFEPQPTISATVH